MLGSPGTQPEWGWEEDAKVVERVVVNHRLSFAAGLIVEELRRSADSVHYTSALAAFIKSSVNFLV